MKLLLNGTSTDLDESLTISTLLMQYKLKPEAVVVEYNLSVPLKNAYDHILLKDGDRIEIVKFMGGG